MAQLTQNDRDHIERTIERYVPSIKNAMRKAFGESGFGTVTIEIKGYIPKVESTNRDREPDPQ